jgi:hypothetical protein
VFTISHSSIWNAPFVVSSPWLISHSQPWFPLSISYNLYNSISIFFGCNWVLWCTSDYTYSYFNILPYSILLQLHKSQPLVCNMISGFVDFATSSFLDTLGVQNMLNLPGLGSHFMHMNKLMRLIIPIMRKEHFHFSPH